MRRRTALACAVLLALGVAGAASAATTATTTTRVVMRTSPAAARVLGPERQLRGMALNDQIAGRSLVSTIPDLPRMKADGLNSVAIYVYLYVADPYGSSVFTGPNTASDTEIAQTIDAARDAGLGVQIHPVLLDAATLTWRGRFMPRDLPAFWASYTAQMVRYAKLGQAHGANLFYVGSENNSLVRYTTQWRAVIKTVRRYFTGALSYMANGKERPLFLADLDLAGLSPYYYLHWKATPSYDDFKQAWIGHTTGRGAVAKYLIDLPVPLIFSEIGFHSQERAFVTPYHAPQSIRDLPAPQAQADAYRALIDVVSRTRGLKGITFWRWAPGTQNPADTSFSPAGKPAECVIARAWSKDPEVRALLASSPTCDLTKLDSTLLTVSDAMALGQR